MQVESDKLFVQGDPTIEVVLRRTARARRLSLRVSRLDGRVTLTIPPRIGIADAARFLSEKTDWVRAQVPACGPEVPALGGTIPLAGRRVPVVAADDRIALPRWQDGIVAVSPSRPVASQVAALLKMLARDRLTAASDECASRVGRTYSRITLRDTRSRWGSCSSDGRLMYSWRLVMAPPEVLEYVAAHEVAHLVEMNHSAAFWSVVQTLCPDYRSHRAWLRERGAELHALRFCS